MTLETQLDQLERAELIRLAQSVPEAEYLFRHVLVQDAAYGSLLRSARRELHQAIGVLLEREYADRLDEQAPLLAHHFHAAEDLTRAMQYYLRAGEYATRQYANAEALDHFESALDLVRHARATQPGFQCPRLFRAADTHLIRSFTIARSCLPSKGFSTRWLDTSSRNARAAGVNAPPVKKTIRSASAGSSLLSSACNSMPDIWGIMRSHRMTS